MPVDGQWGGSPAGVLGQASGGRGSDPGEGQRRKHSKQKEPGAKVGLFVCLFFVFIFIVRKQFSAFYFHPNLPPPPRSKVCEQHELTELSAQMEMFSMLYRRVVTSHMWLQALDMWLVQLGSTTAQAI